MSAGGGSSEYVLEGRVEASGVDAFTSQMASAGSAVDSFKAKVGAAGAGLAALSAGGIAKAVSAAADFEQQMVELEKVTDPSTAREMGSAIQDMAGEMPLAQEELAGIAEQAGRLGIEGTDNIQNFTRVTGEMATATDLTADEAADAFARMSTLMQEPIENVRAIGDATNALSNTMATSSSEITDAATRSSGALTNMGASSSDVLALNATMNTVSSSARIAGTQLRRMAQEMMNPGKVEDLAAALGMTADEFKNMRSNDPTALIKMMAQRMGEGGEAADALRGTLSTTSRQALAGLSQNLDGLNSALGESQKQFDEGGSLAKEFEAAMGTFKNTLIITKNELRNLAISTGGVFLPALTRMLQGVNTGIGYFSKLNEASGGVAGAITLLSGLVTGLTAALYALAGTGAAAALGSVLTVVAALAAPLAAVTAATTALAVAWKQDFGAIRTTTLRVSSAVRETFGGAMADLRATVGPILREIAGAWEGQGGRIASVSETIGQSIGDNIIWELRRVSAITARVTARINSLWSRHGDAILATVTHVSTNLSEAFISALAMISAATDARWGTVIYMFRQGADALLNIWRPLWREMVQFVRNVIHDILDVIATAYGRLTGMTEVETDLMLSTWLSRLTVLHAEIMQTFGRVVSLVREHLGLAVAVTKRLLGQILASTDRVSAALTTTFRASMEAIRLAVQGQWGAVLGQFRRGGSALLGIWRPVWETITDVARNALFGLVDIVATAYGRLTGMTRRNTVMMAGLWKSHTAGVLGDVSRAFSSIVGTVRQKLGVVVEVTSRLLTRVAITAYNILPQFVTEWRDTLDSVIRQVRAHIPQVTGALRSGYRRAQTTVSSVLAQIGGVVQSQLGAIAGYWRRHGGALRRVVRDAYGFVRSHPEQVLVALATTAIPGPLGTIVQAFKSNLAAIRSEVNLTFTSIRQTVRVNMQAVQRQIIGPLLNSESQTRETFTSIRTEVRQSMTVIRDIVARVMGVVAVQFGDHLREMLAIWRAHISGSDGILADAREAFNALWNNAIKPMLDIIQAGWRIFGDDLVRIFRGTLGTVLTAAEIGMDAILTAIQVVLDLIAGDWKGANDAIEGFTKRTFSRIGEWLRTDAAALIGGAVGIIIDAIKLPFEELYNYLIGGSLIPEMFTRIANYISGPALSRILGGIRTLVAQATAAVRQWMQQTYATIQRGFGQAISATLSFRTRIISAIQSTAQRAIATVQRWMSQTFNTVQRTLGQVISATLSFRSRIISTIQSAASAALSTVQQWMGQTYSTIQRALSQVISATSAFGSRVVSTIQSTASTALSTVQQWMSAMYSTAQQGFYQMLSAAQSFGGNLLNWVSSTANSFIGIWNQWLSATSRALSQTFSNIGGFVSQWAGRLLNMIASATSRMWDAWRNFLRMVADGIWQTFNNITEFLTEFFTNLLSTAGDFLFRIHQRIGQFLTNTFTRWTGWAQNVFARTTQLFQNLLGTAADFLFRIHQRIGQFLTNTRARWWQWAQALTARTQQFFQGVLTTAGNYLARTHHRVGQFLGNTRARWWQWAQAVSTRTVRLFRDILSATGSHLGRVHQRIGQFLYNTRGRWAGWAGRMVGRTRKMLGNIMSAVNGWLDGFVRPFREAKERVLGHFEELKDDVAGNSIVPDMLNMTLDQTASWSGDFAGAYSSTADDVSSQFSQMEDAASAPTPTGSFTPFDGSGGGGGGVGLGDIQGELATQTSIMADGFGSGGGFGGGQDFEAIQDRLGDKYGEFSSGYARDLVQHVAESELSGIAQHYKSTVDDLAGYTVSEIESVLRRAHGGDKSAFHSDNELGEAIYNDAMPYDLSPFEDAIESGGGGSFSSGSTLPSDIESRMRDVYSSGQANLGDGWQDLDELISFAEYMQGAMDYNSSFSGDGAYEDTARTALEEVLPGGYQLRGLASGGIVRSPLHALIGEGGPEAVAPLDKLPGILAAAAEEAGGDGGGGVVVNVDRIVASSREEGRQAGRGLDAELRSRSFNE